MKTSRIAKPLTLAVLAGLLAGCRSPNGQPDYTGSGALIGGASGAAIGAVADRGHPGAGALIGGAAGLITGGLIGHGLDRQREAAQSSVMVVSAGRPLSIADIKAMAKAGTSDDTIIAQINNTHSVYFLNAKTIIELRKAGVSDKIITYMINTAANDAVVTAQTPPPPPQTEVIVAPPGPQYVWVHGQWRWNGWNWVWIEGHWALQP